MLLPALNQAREKAKGMECMNNLKQIGQAMQFYTQDNQDNLPNGRTPSGVSPAQYWYSANPGEGYLAPYLTIVKNGNHIGAIKAASRGKLSCPSVPNQTPPSGTTLWTYGYNNVIQSNNSDQTSITALMLCHYAFHRCVNVAKIFRISQTTSSKKCKKKASKKSGSCLMLSSFCLQMIGREMSESSKI